MCLAGNHDLVVRGDIDIGYFAMSAGAAARWTVKVISDDTREYLAALAPLGQTAGVGLYHASPRDPVWEYVLSVRQAADCLDAQRQRVCLIGHSHVACYFSRPNGDSPIEDTIGEVATAGTVLEMPEGEWLVNPGSVGQPRDGDPRAAWLMLDTDAWTATSTASSTRSTTPRRRSSTPGCPASSPTACTRASEASGAPEA